MKIGFTDNGLTINSKPFNPLNICVNGNGIESDRTIKDVDAFEILTTLASVKDSDKEISRLDKIKVLQSLVKNK